MGRGCLIQFRAPSFKHMPMVVHHYFPLGSTNVGDHLVARAIRDAVLRHFGAVEFVEIPVNDRYRDADRPIGLQGENLDRTNAEADLVIVGGSNLLEPRKPRRGRGGWGVFTDVNSIRRLRPPLMLLGMGTGSSFGKSIRRYYPPARDDAIDVEPAKEWVPRGVEVFYTDDLDALVARFQASRGVIGFRLHAALLGLGLGKPVIPVGVDWRGLAFIETIDADAISTRAHRFGQFAKLDALTDRLLSDDPTLISHLAREKANQLESYHAFLSSATR